MIQKNSQIVNAIWSASAEFFEYTSAANPAMPKIEVKAFPASLHQIKETKTIPLDLSKNLKLPYAATGPSLLASYVHINAQEKIETSAISSSHVFFVIRGKGKTETPQGLLEWSEGDFFALPFHQSLIHYAQSDTAMYWVHDGPLFNYMGAVPNKETFRPIYMPKELLQNELAKVRKQNEGRDKNRNGILLGNPDCPMTKTITPTMWSLYNLLPAKSKQKVHRHNSIALDYCVSAGENTYTLIGPNLDENGNIINPIRADWKPGASFVTPPYWWHSHHNESNEDAIVLPVQDAGLHTILQTLNIEFERGY